MATLNDETISKGASFTCYNCKTLQAEVDRLKADIERLNRELSLATRVAPEITKEVEATIILGARRDLEKEVERLETKYDNMAQVASRQIEYIGRLRAALETYADKDNWTNSIGSYQGPKSQLRWFNTLDEYSWSIAAESLEGKP